jgi:peptidoglycan/LPS O-acetylase OafA/YrhL
MTQPNMAHMVRERPHMPALDGLRGIAVLLVIIDHISASISAEYGVFNVLMKMDHLGWTGVDLFFVLSGFLITGILYDAKPGPDFFKNFYARRALRIFPLYYLVLILFLILAPLMAYLDMASRENPVWLYVYLTNIVISFNGTGAFGGLDHFWSLAVEEHFYLVWPAIIYFFSRRAVMSIAVAAMVIAFVCRLAVMAGDPAHYVAAYAATPMRMDSLAAGAFIALAARGPGGISALVKPAFIVAAGALAVFLVLLVVRDTPNELDAGIATLGYPLLWAFFGSVLVLSLKWEPLNAIMRARVLRWFGKYSYGMYVWHPIVFLIVLHSGFAHALRGPVTPLSATVSVAIALALMIVVTLASWHLWEKQFLKLKARFPERAPPLPDHGPERTGAIANGYAEPGSAK